MAPVKRKRDSRASVDAADGARPSPHRPGNSNFGQDRGDEMRGGDGRRGGRQRGGGGYRGGNGNGGRNSRRESTENFHNSRPGTPTTPAGRMSPPARPASSSAQTPAPAPSPSPALSQPAPFVAKRSPTPEPMKNPAPYDYAHITPARVQSWAATGRQEVIQAGAQALDDLDVLDLSVIFQELVRAGIDGLIKPSDAGACVQEILRGAPTSTDADSDKIDGPLLFLDSFSIVADAEPYHHALRYILVASDVSPALMRETLDSQLLSNVGLTSSTFTKRGIRMSTNLLYRQSNHNLLREETEGFAKLITELYTTSDRYAPTSANVEEAFERVKGLIGTFDLDVGRVLDVTLDVFASVLIKRTQFFVKLMRASSWWPRDHIIPGSSSGTDDLPQWALPGSNSFETTEEDRALALPARETRDRLFWDRARDVGMDAFYELGGRQSVDEATKERLIAAKSNHSEADRQWIEATGTLPPSGNRTAAQLLGFKLRFYASAAREKEDVLPDNLIYLVALLIKIGFVSLRDLYPHLQPSDEDMGAYRIKMEKEAAEKEKAQRPGGGTNALMMAGALADDTVPMSRSRDVPGSKAEASGAAAVEDEKDQLPEPRNQKALLLINLLTIGAIPESLFMLGRFPWLVEVEPKIYQLLHRILIHSIEKVFATTKPSSETSLEVPQKKQLDPDQAGVPKGSLRLQPGKSRKPFRWPYPDRHDEADGISYEFYWKEWCDSIPVCQSVDDIFTLCDTLLNISGVNIGSNAALLSKLASIGNKSLSEDTTEANLSRWRDLLKRILVPALSHTNSNTNLVNQIYDMLRYYQAPVRYNIYAEWFEGPTTRLPAMVKVFTKAKLETLATMKRISKTNVLQMARALAKTAYANPGIVFKVALSQIEAYSNLTEVVVECAKYFTDLGYDVLVWCLMSSLGGQSRSRTQGGNALLTSRWLLALSNFAGKVFKRFSIMNPAPILQYVNNQVYNGNATDLVILQELIKQMCGIVPDTDFTDSQLLALTGGPVLRRQTLISLQDKRYESEKTSKRLMKSLTDTRLAGQLLVAIAQYRQTALFRVPEEGAYIKYLSATVDDTQRIMMQYLDLLRSSLTAEQFDDLVPNTLDLIAQFGLDPALAFALGRASYAAKMEAAGGTTTPPKTIRASTGSDDDVVMEASYALENAITNGDVQMSDAMDISTTSGNVVDSPKTSTDSWNDVLKPLITSIQTVLPDKPWDLLSPEFYVAFWQLTLFDIQVPMDSYTAESSRLTKEISDLLRIRSMVDADKREKQRKELEDIKEQVLLESKDQMSQFGRNRSRLNKSKLAWFSNVDSRYDPLCDALLEECLLPRLLVSPSDADYAFKMIKFMHNTATPHFRTLGLLSRLFKPNRLRVIIFSCTIREAECFGRFLKSILGDLAKWHSSRAVYEKEAWGVQKDLPGFAKSMSPDGKALNLLEYEEFRRILYMWHKNLNNALKVCLAGDEWMHLRNAITVLKGVVDHFPALEFMGTQFMKTLERISKREKDKRDDLSLLASASLPELNKRKGKWIMPQAFALNIGTDSMQTNGKTSSATPETKTVLKATAPEFKPSSASLSDGKTESTKKAEAEDGELRDAKTTAPAQTSSSASFFNQADASRGRSDTSRNLPAKPVAGRPSPSNASAGLPNRPERGQVDRGVPSRGADRRDLHQSRVDRGVDNNRYPVRDAPGPLDRGVPDRRELTKNTSFERPNPRDRFNVNRAGDPFTDARADARQRNERPPMLDHRGVDLNSPKTAEPERGPSVNPERLALIDPNVARAAETTEPPRSNSPRDHRDEKPHSRPHSPRRGDRGLSGRGAAPETLSAGPRGRNDASSPSRPGHSDRIPSGRGQTSSAQVDGPARRDVPSSRSTDNWGGDRARDAFRPAPPMPQVSDPDHGRLSQPSRHDETSFGRLNAAPEIPSGPRQGPRGGNNRQGGQNMAQSQGSSRAPSPGRAPPTGPSNDRSGRRRTDSRPPGSSAGASAAPPAPPVHPERLAHLAPEVRAQVIPPSGPSQSSSQAPSNAPSQPSGGMPPGLHPSRMRDWNDTNTPSTIPPHVQSSMQSSNSNGRSGPPGAANAPSPVSTAPPSGPRGQNQGQMQNQNQNSQPSTPTSAGGGVPTGPSGRERGHRGQGYLERQMGGINSIIKGAERPSDRSRDRNGNDRGGMNVRGRGAVGAPGPGQSVSDQFTINSNPATQPASAPRDMRPSGRRDLGPEPTAPDSSSRSGRRDLGPEPSAPDLPRSKEGGDEDKLTSGRPGSMRDFDRRERSGRRSQHGSRDRTPERSDRAPRDAVPGLPSTDSRDAVADPNKPPLRDVRSSGDLRRESGRERDSSRRSSARGAGSMNTPGQDGGRDRADISRSGRNLAMGHRDGAPGAPGAPPPPPPPAGGPPHMRGEGFGIGSQYGAPPGMGGHGGRDSRGGMRDDRRGASGISHPSGPGGIGSAGRGPNTPSGVMDDNAPHSGSKRRGDDRMDRGRDKRPRQG